MGLLKLKNVILEAKKKQLDNERKAKEDALLRYIHCNVYIAYAVKDGAVSMKNWPMTFTIYDPFINTDNLHD
ncbi:hypothetical protein CHS0354_018690 [Potamilus streckersoni]|uniref:Uncharacterized protein n=1 Tax=Potamilus streckersoni TaxID=2493646 RepID=A0AAE0VXH3_9BIVA|nr:hypothetical protein CHS0354_018690 [Potamilus streckersoni]